MIVLILDLILLLGLVFLWANLERKWRTIIVSQDPNITYWNHVYISPDEDASVKLQAIIDFHSNRGGGLTRLSSDTYTPTHGLYFGGRGNVELRGSNKPEYTPKELEEGYHSLSETKIGETE